MMPLQVNGRIHSIGFWKVLDQCNHIFMRLCSLDRDCNIHLHVGVADFPLKYHMLCLPQVLVMRSIKREIV